MRVIWIYVALACVTLAICGDSLSTSDTKTLEPLAREKGEDTDDDDDDASGNLANHKLEDDNNDDDNNQSDLPILPPIILLDFADDAENNSTSDEKSKRTINNELGYGYLKNNLLSGKFNYYFPGGKTGTTVSIEESISPFEPKTIIESFKSNTERTIVPSSTYQPELTQPVGQPIAQPWSAAFPSNQPIFGQRTKLRKAPSNAFTYQYFSTTPQPDYNNHNMAYTTSKPFNNHYNVHSSTPGYNSKYSVLGLTPPGSGFLPDNPTTPRAILSDDPTHFNLPRYTIENGIKYENKIIWKYPDGRIADNPPTSYINSYAEFPNSQINKGASKNSAFKSSLIHQSPPLMNSGLGKFRNENHHYHSSSNVPQVTHYPMEPISNIYSQRPAQFPTNQDSNIPSRPSAGSQIQSFDFSYQDNYGLRQRGNVAMAPVKNDQSPPRTSLKLSADTDNAEYTYTPPARPFTATTPVPNHVTQSGQSTSQAISKFTPQVQKYLSKVFTNPKTDEKLHQQQQQHHYHQQQQQQSVNSAAFIKNNYENILNYNPSISQYIRDPSSILNAQPTFIQAGNSLVPVIILRVDVARPIESQPSSNINLKSLLQQYITNYVGNQVTNQKYGYDQHKASTHTDNYSLLNDLSQFTQALKRYSANGEVASSRTSSQLRLADHPLNYDDTRYTPKTSYDVLDTGKDINDNLRLRNNGKTKKSQKVKSVEIINGPHIQVYREGS